MAEQEATASLSLRCMHACVCSWDPLFCDGHPQALDGEKFADCASLTQQGAGPPCLRARSCDASLAAVCSLRLRTGTLLACMGSRGWLLVLRVSYTQFRRGSICRTEMNRTLRNIRQAGGTDANGGIVSAYAFLLVL